MKTLLVLRHAKSSWDDSSVVDRERPLNARGRRDAPRIGDLLRDEGVVPDLIITSDAVRAHTTALAVAEAAEYSGDVVVDPMLYLASPDDILAVLNSIPDPQPATVMIVGHNPGLEDFIAQLTGTREEMPTAALARLAVPVDLWADLADSVQATLVNLWRPHEIWP